MAILSGKCDASDMRAIRGANVSTFISKLSNSLYDFCGSPRVLKHRQLFRILENFGKFYVFSQKILVRLIIPPTPPGGGGCPAKIFPISLCFNFLHSRKPYVYTAPKSSKCSRFPVMGRNGKYSGLLDIQFVFQSQIEIALF